MAGITGLNTFESRIMGLIAMIAAVIITVYNLFHLIFDRGYLIDLWNKNTIFGNALYVFSSIFCFFITLIFIYGVIELINGKMDPSRDGNTDEVP